MPTHTHQSLVISITSLVVTKHERETSDQIFLTNFPKKKATTKTKSKGLQILERIGNKMKKKENRSLEQTNIARSFMQNHVNHFPYNTTTEMKKTENIVMEKVKQQQIAHKSNDGRQNKRYSQLFIFPTKTFYYYEKKKRRKKGKLIFALRNPCGSFIAKIYCFAAFMRSFWS